MVGVIHANSVQDALQRFSDREDFSVLSQIINTIVFLEKGVVTKIYDVGFTIKVPEGMGSEMHIRPVTTVTDSETGSLVLDVFRYDGQTIVMPVIPECRRRTCRTKRTGAAGPERRPAGLPGQQTGQFPCIPSPTRPPEDRQRTALAGNSTKKRSSARSGGTRTVLSMSR